MVNAPPMHKTGYVIMNDNTPLIQTYIIDNSFIDVFRDLIMDHKSTVRLGDSLTTIDITQIITLKVSFLDNAAVTHYVILNFSIMHMKNIDMIIGISSIHYSFYDLFLDMLKTARLKSNPISVPLTTMFYNVFSHVYISQYTFIYLAKISR
jgi:hypothetical protein